MKVGVPLVAVFVAVFGSNLIATASLAVVSEATSVAEAEKTSTTAGMPSMQRKQQLPRKQQETLESTSSILPSEVECVWIGKRIISLLRREDVDTAHTFDRFYTAFGCPMAHLGKVFGCVVAPESEQEAVDERIDRCWADPHTYLSPLLYPPLQSSLPSNKEDMLLLQQRQGRW